MLSKDIKDGISDSLKDSFDSVRFFQDQVVILDDKKSKWDNAIFIKTQSLCFFCICRNYY